MRSASLALLTLCLSTTALAQTQPLDPQRPAVPAVNAAPTRMDPRIETLFAYRRRTGLTSPIFLRSDRFEREGTMPVAVQFSTPPSAQRQRELLAWGIDPQITTLASGDLLIRIQERHLAALAAAPDIVRVECGLTVRSVHPDLASIEETHVSSVRRALRLADGTELDGRGVLIADLDSGAYVFHPAFFRPDAGMFRWIDVDSNGRFSPRIDAIDLNNNDTADDDERALTLVAKSVSRFGPSAPLPGNGSFDASRDWLYIDTNRNNHRDSGSLFDETTPAYGEPTFVVDDVNHNGRLDPSEHVLRLGTSRFRAVRGRTVFRRGADNNPLSFYDPIANGATFDDVEHATSVIGILTGGVYDQSLLQGIAPGAEVLLCDVDAAGNDGELTLAQFAIDERANVILTEFGRYINVTMDGSSAFERLLDSAFDHGAVVVSPAGNLAEGNKHRTMQITPGNNRIVLDGTNSFQGAVLLGFSLHYKAAPRSITFRITTPDAQTFNLPANNPAGAALTGGFEYSTSVETTSRGTTQHFVNLIRRGALPEGRYIIELDVSPGNPFNAEVFVGDNVSSWGGGIEIENPDNNTTLCNPATADRPIAVAAYVLHGEPDFLPWGRQGERAGYSSQGPRIDGDTGIDIASPDNPLAPIPDDPDFTQTAAYSPFGGTSGAGPHVTAVMALLKQKFPNDTPTQLRDRLLNNARNDAAAPTTTPTLTGRGKLDAARALGLTDLTSEGRPTVTLTGPSTITVGTNAQVTVAATGTGPFRVRWDLDYNGTFDTDWLPLSGNDARTLSITTAGIHDVRADIMDSFGAVSGATLRLNTNTSNSDASVTDAADAGTSTSLSGGGCACSAPARTSSRSPLAYALLAALTLSVRRYASRSRARSSTAR